MAEHLVKIAPSPIQGNGLFAVVDIPKGTKISYFTGVEMSYRDFKAKYGNDWRFVYQRPPWLAQIVAKDCRNLVTYVNDGYFGSGPGLHNCHLKSRWLITDRLIRAGEELLLKYPNNYWSKLKH